MIKMEQKMDDNTCLKFKYSKKKSSMIQLMNKGMDKVEDKKDVMSLNKLLKEQEYQLSADHDNEFPNFIENSFE
jgi:predicted GTPase